jgi:hypothetical protein
MDPMEAMTRAMTPGPEHEALARMAGRWTVQTTAQMGPSAPAETSTGSAERRMILGGRVLEESFKGSMMGQPFEGSGRNGYDNVRKEFWGTWSDTGSTGVILLRGSRDPATGRMTMKGEMTNPMSGKPTPLRIESRHEGDNREVHEFYWTNPDGTTWKGMEMIYERA